MKNIFCFISSFGKKMQFFKAMMIYSIWCTLKDIQILHFIVNLHALYYIRNYLVQPNENFKFFKCRKTIS